MHFALTSGDIPEFSPALILQMVINKGGGKLRIAPESTPLMSKWSLIRGAENSEGRGKTHGYPLIVSSLVCADECSIRIYYGSLNIELSRS